MDTHVWVLWVGVFVAGMHVLEEHAEGWVNWANQELGPRFGVTFTDTDFFLTNAMLMFLAIAAAAIGWAAPAVSLSVSALFIINAIFFHMIPSSRAGRLTPGTLSAVFLYLPVAAWTYWAAADDGVLTFWKILLSLVLGALLMAWPIAVLLLRKNIGWEPVAAGYDQPGGTDGESLAADQLKLDEQTEEETGSEDKTAVLTQKPPHVP